MWIPVQTTPQLSHSPTPGLSDSDACPTHNLTHFSIAVQRVLSKEKEIDRIIDAAKNPKGLATCGRRRGAGSRPSRWIPSIGVAEAGTASFLLFLDPLVHANRFLALAVRYQIRVGVRQGLDSIAGVFKASRTDIDLLLPSACANVAVRIATAPSTTARRILSRTHHSRAA